MKHIKASDAKCADGSCARGVGTCPPCLLVWGGFAVYVLVSWLF
jgi:hypothetical protein